MVQRHNDLVGPLITSHQGTIVRSVQDTIMASYAEPTHAVQSVIAMQRALRDHNREREAAEQLRIRIGINAGPGLVETQDVFGNVVHVAARVEACALPDQILTSSATYERLPLSVPCRFLGATHVQGKATPIELYDALVQIPWELLFDGQDFLCRRFSMGRLVSTQQALVERQERRPKHSLKMLIVADPQGDLLAAAREGTTIREDLAGEAERLRVDLRHRVGTTAIKAALRQYDVLHYAGHAEAASRALCWPGEWCQHRLIIPFRAGFFYDPEPGERGTEAHCRAYHFGGCFSA